MGLARPAIRQSFNTVPFQRSVFSSVSRLRKSFTVSPEIRRGAIFSTFVKKVTKEKRKKRTTFYIFLFFRDQSPGIRRGVIFSGPFRPLPLLSSPGRLAPVFRSPFRPPGLSLFFFSFSFPAGDLWRVRPRFSAFIFSDTKKEKPPRVAVAFLFG